MKIIYLNKYVLRDKNFINNLVMNIGKPKRVILIHDHFSEKPADTRFVTKRISALLSESLVVNNPISGDQKGVFTMTGNEVTFRKEELLQMFEHIQLIVLNPLVAGENGTEMGDAASILAAIKRELPDSEMIIFPAHPLSPIVAEPKSIHSENDYLDLLKVYEEEKEMLELARQLMPARLVSVKNFML